MRSGNRACRAGRNTTVTRSAAIWNGFVWRQFKRRENFCKKKPGSKSLIDKHGALTVPADARLCGVIPFEHRPGIDIRFLLPAKAAKKLIDSIQLCFDYIVIIFAPSVSRDLAGSCCSRGSAGWVALVLI